jgi:hypothetical protein
MAKAMEGVTCLEDIPVSKEPQVQESQLEQVSTPFLFSPFNLTSILIKKLHSTMND